MLVCWMKECNTYIRAEAEDEFFLSGRDRPRGRGGVRDRRTGGGVFGHKSPAAEAGSHQHSKLKSAATTARPAAGSGMADGRRQRVSGEKSPVGGLAEVK